MKHIRFNGLQWSGMYDLWKLSPCLQSDGKQRGQVQSKNGPGRPNRQFELCAVDSIGCGSYREEAFETLYARNPDPFGELLGMQYALPLVPERYDLTGACNL